MQDIINFLSSHPLLSISMVIVLILLMIIEFFRNQQKAFALTPLQATQKINHDHAIVIDLRDKESYLKSHIINSISLPLAEIKNPTQSLVKYKGKPLIFVCNSGLEAQKIAAQSLKQGYNAYSLAGGIRSWSQAEMPLIKESK